ncbi:SGNH/GDSL hydrolase family protein [Caballeronia sp. SBC2]|uniref:SGNH/GDSL hydrolase family protein n=1 Tax=unclassified Caballeronia TaxID=2646786 RepID=UPI00351A069F
MKSMKPALTKPAARQTRWLLAVQTATACAALAMLAACGGSSNNSNNTPAGGVTLQVVSFGDSLSDVGTYAPVATANFGGGRFTTNPGQIWTQNVAQYYGGTLTAANTGGFGIPLSPASGLGYAQGGSRVTLQPGVGHATPGTANSDYSQATTIPINDQVTQYIGSHGSFNANQLVLVNGGANDIFYNLTVEQATAAGIQAQLAAGTITPAQAQAAGAAAQTAATTAISQAAIDLATVVGRVVQAGATHVVVSTVPDIGGSPLGLASADQGVTFSQVTQLFNGTLQGALQQAGLLSKVIYVNAYTWVDGIQANYQANGFTVSNTGTACNLNAMIAAATKLGEPDPSAFGTSLFCSPQTYTVAGADQTYMYADTVHPTTHLHALFSTYVEQQIAASGLGK